jgi:hypothetical protein
MIQGIFDLILETVLTQGEKILISSNTYPTQLVKSKFLKLNYSHIEYVMGYEQEQNQGAEYQEISAGRAL